MQQQHSQNDNAHRYTPSRLTKAIKPLMHLQPHNHNFPICFKAPYLHQTIRYNATRIPDTHATQKLVFDINSTDTRQPDTATGCQSKPS